MVFIVTYLDFAHLAYSKEKMELVIVTIGRLCFLATPWIKHNFSPILLSIIGIIDSWIWG